MRKVLLAAIVLSFIFAVASPLLSAGDETKSEAGKAMCQKGPVFSEEQKAKMAELRLAMREKNIDLKAKLEKLGIEMRREFDKPEPSATVLGRIVDDMAATRAAIQKNGIGLALAVRQMLTPEQRAMMKERGMCCPGGGMMEGVDCGEGGHCCPMMMNDMDRGGCGGGPHMMMGTCGSKGGEHRCMKGHGRPMGCGDMDAKNCMKAGEGCMKGMGEGCCSMGKEAGCSKEKAAAETSKKK